MHRFHVPTALLPVALAVAVAGCGGTTRTVTPTSVTAAPAATQPQARGHEYPANVQHNFIVACTRGATESQCKCVLKKLEARYTLAQVNAIEQRMTANVAPPADFTRIATECRK